MADTVSKAPPRPTEEFLDELVSIFNAAPIARSLGMSIEYNERGEAACTFPRNPDYDHGGHDVHGGVLATLLDTAAWFTVAARYGHAVVTSDLHVRMLRPARRLGLRATAKVVRLGSKAAVTQMEVVDEGGALVAVGTASLARIGQTP